MKPELQIAFKGYSEEEIKDILAAFRVAKYQVNRFYKVSLTEVSLAELIVTILVSGIISEVLKVFAGEIGKGILAKLFSPIKTGKKSSLRVTIEDQKGEKSTTIIAKDIQEFQLKIRKRGERRIQEQ